MTAARFVALLTLFACSDEFPSLQTTMEEIEVCADAATDLDSELAFRAGQTLEALAYDAPSMEPRDVDVELARAGRSFDAIGAGKDMGLLLEEIRLDFVDGGIDRVGLSYELGQVMQAVPGELEVEGRPELVHAFECGRWAVHDATPLARDT